MQRPPRLVLDTNTIIRAFSDFSSPSGVLVRRCEARIYPILLSKSVLAEYFTVLRYPRIAQRLEHIPVKDTHEILDRLRYLSDYFHPVTEKFPYDRDIKDSKFLELAIAGRASHLITHDRDLLSLQHAHSPEARRLRRNAPALRILTAADFLHAIGKSPGNK